MEGLKEERAVSRNRVPTLATIGALRGAFHNMRGIVWQPFVLSLGVPMKSLGGLESTLDLTRIIAQPVLGGASDAFGRKRFIIARDIIALTTGILIVLTRSWHLLFVSVVLLGFENALYPIWSSLVAESFEPTTLGYIYSVLGTGSMAAGLSATLTAGYIAEAYGYKSVFIIATVLVFLSLCIVLIKLAETKGPTLGAVFSLRDLSSSLVGILRPSLELRGFYVAMTVDLFAFNMGYRLLNGMLSKGYGYTPQMLSIIWAVMTGSMALFQIPLGRYVDRIGYVRYLAASQSLACIVLGITVLSKEFWVVVAAQALMGFSAAFWGPAEQAWIAKNVNPNERARAIGSYAAFRGLLSFPAPFLGGVLFDTYGFDVPIVLNIVIAIVDIALILYLIKE